MSDVIKSFDRKDSIFSFLFSLGKLPTLIFGKRISSLSFFPGEIIAPVDSGEIWNRRDNENDGLSIIDDSQVQQEGFSNWLVTGN